MGLFNGARRSQKKHINADTPLEAEARNGKKAKPSKEAGKRKASKRALHENKSKSGEAPNSLQPSNETEKTSPPSEKAAERHKTTDERLAHNRTAFA